MTVTDDIQNTTGTEQRESSREMMMKIPGKIRGQVQSGRGKLNYVNRPDSNVLLSKVKDATVNLNRECTMVKYKEDLQTSRTTRRSQHNMHVRGEGDAAGRGLPGTCSC